MRETEEGLPGSGARSGRPAELERYHEEDAELGTRLFAPSVTLKYAGHALRYVVASNDLSLEVAGPRLAFVADATESPSADVRCDIGPVECAEGPPLLQGASTWAIRRLAGGVEEVCYGLDRAVNPAPWCRLRHDAALSSFDLRFAPREERRIVNVGFPTDEYIMSRRLARSGGVILHAASLLHDGAAYLFMGHSGAGKSTTAMHAVTVGAEVLSDDRTIVTIAGDGRLWAWGTPWHGSFRRATNAAAPVAALFLVVQGDEESVTPITAARAVGEAFVRIVHPSPDGSEVRGTLDTIERLARTVPVAELRQRAGPAGYLAARRFAGCVAT